MRHIVETGTDGATICFFDPAALPPDFDERIEDDPVSTFEALEREGRFWWRSTDGDGSYLFHFYVDQDVPEPISTHSRGAATVARFLVPSGVIWACGAEYAARDPAKTVECCEILGLCFREKGMPQLALKWYQKGLDMPDLGEHEGAGLRYDIAEVYREQGDYKKAMLLYTEVYGLDSTYRHVADKIKEMKKLLG